MNQFESSDWTKLKNKSIIVVGGGFDGEKSISIKSAKNVFSIIKKYHQNVSFYELNNLYHFIDYLKNHSCDIIYNTLHGNFGEDGGIQSLLSQLNIKYTGENASTSALCFNKLYTKHLFKSYYQNKNQSELIFKTADFIELNMNEEKSLIRKKIINFGFPLFVKPLSGGSSVNVHLIESEKKLNSILPQLLNQSKEKLFIEKAIRGREITVGVFKNCNNNIQVLPITELKTKNQFYNYEAKYTKGLTQMLIPANLVESISKEIKVFAQSFFNLIHARECIRIDMIIEKQQTQSTNIVFLEANTSPGMTDTSDIPKMLEASKVSLNNFCYTNLIHSLELN